LTLQLAAEKSKLKEMENHLDRERHDNRELREKISLLEMQVL
jgi:hypothetical protein